MSVVANALMIIKPCDDIFYILHKNSLDCLVQADLFENENIVAQWIA